MPRVMKGLEKSMTFSRSAVMVKAATARSAFCGGRGQRSPGLHPMCPHWLCPHLPPPNSSTHLHQCPLLALAPCVPTGSAHPLISSAHYTVPPTGPTHPYHPLLAPPYWFHSTVSLYWLCPLLPPPHWLHPF